MLLITSNYNTWSQCILRYANLVSRPLVLTPVALEEGKWDKWAATNRIMHKRSRFPEDIWPGLPLLFTWKTLWEIGSRISMLVYRCAEIQPIFMTAVDRSIWFHTSRVSRTDWRIRLEIYFVGSLTLSKKAFNVLKGKYVIFSCTNTYISRWFKDSRRCYFPIIFTIWLKRFDGMDYPKNSIYSSSMDEKVLHV